MKQLTIGYLLDLIIGDPQNPLHPIRLIGNLCKRIENYFRKELSNSLKMAGLLTWISVVLIVFIFTNLILKLGYGLNYIFGIMVSGIIIYFCIATKSLKIRSFKGC